MKRSAPDYFCTWLEQGRRWARQNYPYTNLIDAWAVGAPDMLNSRDFFGPEGLADSMPEDLRRHLIFLIDSGWDVPSGTPNAQDMRFGALIPDDGRFPEVAGKSPLEKLTFLVQQLKQRHWKGVGIWVPAHECGTLLEGDSATAFWSEKILLSKAAGICYWKVDWGRRMYDITFRKMLTDLGKSLYPELWIEHALVPPGHLNDGKGDGVFKDARCLESAAGQLEFCDVFRTYDCTWSVSNSVSMGRAVKMMELMEGKSATGECILNLESNPVLAIALGGTFGTMSPPESSILPEALGKLDDSMDNALCGYEQLRLAVNFRRLAAPAAVGLKAVKNHISKVRLLDTYCLPEIYGSDSGWIKISVPVAVSRGVELPERVDETNPASMIAATAYPDNVYAIAAIPRAVDGKIAMAPVTARYQLPEKPEKLGCFGHFSHLELKWTAPSDERVEYEVIDLSSPDCSPGSITASGGYLTLGEEHCNTLLRRK